mmetsp:Transcript_10834/g.24568  ORF Transcript_10834/g.24568 Transcript_10834/m.24568 type:complete len:291 (+) Transcript_10834:2343-3215(+)
MPAADSDIGLYTSRCWSKAFCRSSESASALALSMLLALVSLSPLIRTWFLRMLPSLLASCCSRLRSSSASLSLRSSSFLSRILFCSSSSGFSCWIVRPSNCPSRPERVTLKFTIVTRAAQSGSTRICELRETRKRRKESLKSTTLSPMLTTLRGPCTDKSRRSRGTRTGSMTSTSPMMSTLPNRTATSRVLLKRSSCCVMTSTGPSAPRWFLSQTAAWLEGSRTSGNCLQLRMVTAFSIDSPSAGRPCVFHVRRWLSVDAYSRRLKDGRPSASTHDRVMDARTFSAMPPR